MTRQILNYTFSSTTVSCPEGDRPVTFAGATVCEGPGRTTGGDFPLALDLGATGKSSVSLAGLQPNTEQFCIRMVFAARGPVSQRQNLVESDFLPFSLFLDQGANQNEFVLQTSAVIKGHGRNGPSTRFIEPLRPGVWYVADFVYDIDTAALFIDGDLVSIHAFPPGKVNLLQGDRLFVGTWIDGNRDHFDGKIAGLQWYDGVPAEVGAALDEWRTDAEWFITNKYNSICQQINLGSPLGKPGFDALVGAYVQRYDNGLIMYHDSIGAAFEMHGAIYEFYKTYQQSGELGYLVSDEGNTTKLGGRKSVFSKGAIYYSGQTGPIPVTGQIYVDYEGMGESGKIGFPVSAVNSVPGGFEQVFGGARMYCKLGDARAHEVHGAILSRFLALGGCGTWGFPLTNECDVKKDEGVIGKCAEFEHATFYWSPGRGAFEVHGEIRRKYLELGGPGGELGFPISDEGAIPGVPLVGRYNCFENGSLLWFGNYDGMMVARPFQIFLGRIDTRESEDFLMGQNDLYCQVSIIVGASIIYDQRHPSSGDWEGRNIVDLNLTVPVTIVPNDPNRDVTFTVDVWEADAIEGDDHLGTYSKVLDMANGWGLKESNGVFNSGAFDFINAITWSVQPLVDFSKLSESDKHWGVGNIGTDDLSYGQYAAAFCDVDSEPEWWDIPDWLERLFFKLVVEDLAECGNCFGMSLEGIYARKHRSIFSLPLKRFTQWEELRNEFNVKHCYQVGAGPIWWFVKEFISGNTHDPVDVFRRTRDEFNRGNNPVLCVAQNSDFSGAPHAVLPVAWNDSSKPWRITLCDPNFPASTRELKIDPDNNNFEYVGGTTYGGGEWSGGRLHFMPYNLLDQPPRTPIWDAVILILAGTILILGDDAQTTSITDGNGNDVDGFGVRATQTLQAGRHLDDFFVGFKGSGTGRGAIRSQILMRMEKESQFAVVGGLPLSDFVAHLPIGVLLEDRRLRPMVGEIFRDPKARRALSRRSVQHVLNDPATGSILSAQAQEMLGQLTASARNRNVVHRFDGVRTGSMEYVLKHRLSQWRLTSDMTLGEPCELGLKQIGSSKHVVHLKSSRAKVTTLEVENKLGVGKDSIKVKLENLPVDTGRDLEVNLKPGLGGVELLVGVAGANARVSITGTIAGRTIDRSYTIPVEGGFRLSVASVLSHDVLGVSRIDRLFGPSLRRDLFR